MSGAAIEAKQLQKTYPTTCGVLRREHVEQAALRDWNQARPGGLQEAC